MAGYVFRHEDVDPGDAVWTYRYLRIGLICAVAFLAASVIGTTVSTQHLQGSISAYYYTISHAALIGSLCAIGLGLIAYKGSTATEDIVLNSSGFLAFVVAVVPTQRPDCPDSPPACGQWLPTFGDTTAAVPNNLTALVIAVVTGVAAYLAAGAVHAGPQPRWPAPRPRRWWLWIARLSQVAAVAAGLIVLHRRPDLFMAWAHDVAAVAMFVGIILVVAHYAWYSASRPKRADAPPRPMTVAYLAIVAVLSVSLVTAILLRPGNPVLIVEAILILGFAAFWCVQTVDLWENEQKYCRIDHMRVPG